MKFMEEIVVDAFLPTVRSLLAEELLAQQLTQHEVARVLGLSQSAVSKYAHGEIERHPQIAADDRVQATVQDLASGLAHETIAPEGALIELEVLIREMEAPGDVLAQLHEAAVPGLSAYDSSFAIHDPDSSIRTRELVRTSVRQALRELTTHPNATELLPQVGANIVECIPGGRTPDDVVGVPGRLIAVSGRVELPAEPDFGVSGHLAGILLAIQEIGNPARAAMNIRFDSDYVEQLTNQELIEIPGDADIVSMIREESTVDESTQVIAQTGGFGIEPIIYLFGNDASTVVARALALLE